jgi:hypothetical protein
MPAKIKSLERLASEKVGDGCQPNLFFVTDNGVVVTITRSFPVAYAEWRAISFRSPRVECALEDRKHGTVCSVAPEADDIPRLVITDDSHLFNLAA